MEKKAEKNEHRNVFHPFLKLPAHQWSWALSCSELSLWVTTLQKATLLLWVMHGGTEIHTETSFWLTTKDSDQHTTPINVQSMAKTWRRQIQQKRESSKLDFSGPTSEGLTLTELKCGFSCSCSNDFMVLWGRRGEKRALSICWFSVKLVHYQRH